MGVDINQCTIEGRLGAYPEDRILSSGTKAARARIAVSDDYKDGKGEWKSRTYWITVQAYQRAADELMLFAKGDRILVIGKWTVEEFTRNGKKEYYNKLDIHSVRGSDHRYPQRRDGQAAKPAAEPQTDAQRYRDASGGTSSAAAADFDDDIPF